MRPASCSNPAPPTPPLVLLAQCSAPPSARSRFARTNAWINQVSRRVYRLVRNPLTPLTGHGSPRPATATRCLGLVANLGDRRGGGLSEVAAIFRDCAGTGGFTYFYQFEHLGPRKGILTVPGRPWVLSGPG